MTFFAGIAMIASTFPHCAIPRNMYSSSNVDSFLARVHHSLRALLRPLQVRANRPQKTLSIRRNKKISIYKETFVDYQAMGPRVSAWDALK
jgi:hypothetical protein